MRHARIVFSTRNRSDVDAASRTARANHTRPTGGSCLLYTSDAADERSSVDLGGRRIIKKKEKQKKKKRYKHRLIWNKQLEE